MNGKRCAIVFIILSLLIVILICINTMTGSVRISAGDAADAFIGHETDKLSYKIIRGIRLPRIAAAVILGGALALSGYLLQTFFDNPIVGPFVLGISSGAKLTVALVMIFLLSKGRYIGAFTMVMAAFVGALIAMGFVLIISLRVRSMSVLVVCGIMIGYICSAVTDFAVTFADDSNIVNLHNWSMGSLSGMSWSDVRVMTVIVAVCLIASFLISKPIGAYRLGEAYARSMGVNILLLRVFLILISSLLAACVTAFAGPISFVGIAVPHLMKKAVATTSPKVMVFACFMGGAAVTLICDCIARSVFAPTEVSISSVTAVLLVPVVIFIMISHRSRGERT